MPLKLRTWQLAVALVLGGPASAAIAQQDSPSAKLAPPSDGLKVERIVMVYRHGLRAPLETEIGALAYSPQPWPRWSVPAGELTPHGREGVRLIGRYDRALFDTLGLAGWAACPNADDLLIYTDSDARSTASGDELREGLAPGCQTPIGHRPLGIADPLFSADASGLAPVDATRARAAINTYEGGPAAKVARHRDDFGALEAVLGCSAAAKPTCNIAGLPTTLGLAGDRIELGGPIAITSGTGEVLLLQYAEGRPLAEVGWGRTTPDRLAAASRLHGLLFDVHAKPPYMAQRTAAALAPAVRDLLLARDGPRIVLFVGHDNNIAALAALLGADVAMPSYGAGDYPLGGGIGFELLADAQTGRRYVRLFYQAQTLDQLRTLAPLTLADPPATQLLSPRCARGPSRLCPIEAFARLLTWTGQAAAPIKEILR